MSITSRMTLDEVRRSYARLAPRYDARRWMFGNGARRATQWISRARAGTVLEVGVGTGCLLPFYGSHLQISGIDVSSEMLAQARARVAGEGLSHIRELREMDAAQLDYPDNHFDTIAVMHVMTVVPDPERVLRELERVCKPGGQVVIVNHFYPKQIARLVTRLFAPLTRLLGWNALHDAAAFIRPCRLDLIAHERIGTFGFCHMLCFQKPPGGVAQPVRAAES